MTRTAVYLIYLINAFCPKSKYAGKAETPFNIRLSNHRLDIFDKHFIPTSDHFAQGDTNFPIDTGRKLNVNKTFRRRPRRLLNILCTFNLRPVSTGIMITLNLS